MSNPESKVAVAVAELEHGHDPHGGHNHDPNLAHHFETPEQQYQSGKLGMWIFLATEILMFGGLFCFYSVYRHTHPEVFEYAHQYLDKKLGAINTMILITSSLTMAWGVRAAQMGNRKLTNILLLCTILGGVGFMGIKSIEYGTKWREEIFAGHANRFRPAGEQLPNSLSIEKLEEEHLGAEPGKSAEPNGVVKATADVADPNAGTDDQAQIKPPNITPAGLAPRVLHEPGRLLYNDLDALDKHRVYTFFGAYFFMTGLHAVHVLVGMGLLTWILIRSINREFGPTYFTPVDLVGLYWHLVDLIWIFLFPLLYLIT